MEIGQKIELVRITAHSLDHCNSVGCFEEGDQALGTTFDDLIVTLDDEVGSDQSLPHFGRRKQINLVALAIREDEEWAMDRGEVYESFRITKPSQDDAVRNTVGLRCSPSHIDRLLIRVERVDNAARKQTRKADCVLPFCTSDIDGSTVGTIPYEIEGFMKILLIDAEKSG